MSDLRAAWRSLRVRLMRRRRAAYRELFASGIDGPAPAQRAVLADLKRFCHAEYPTFDADPRVHALREGRREVWLRIQQFINLSDQDIADIREDMDDELE